MKRILAAFSIAILIHIALLAMGPRWLRHQKPVAPRTQVTTIRLVAHPLPEMHPLPPPPLPLPPRPQPPSPPKATEQKPVDQQKPISKTPKKILRPPEALLTPVPMPAAESAPPEPDPLPKLPARIEKETAVGSDEKAVSASPATPPPAQLSTRWSETSDAATAVVLAKPRYSQNPPPVYPSIARRRRYQGTVILEVFVLESGQVGDLRIAESSKYSLLDRAAMKAVRRWQFEPARKGDREVAMWVKVPIRFNLK